MSLLDFMVEIAAAPVRATAAVAKAAVKGTVAVATFDPDAATRAGDDLMRDVETIERKITRAADKP